MAKGVDEGERQSGGKWVGYEKEGRGWIDEPILFLTYNAYIKKAIAVKKRGGKKKCLKSP
ncbi:hypothetical protein [Deinococcus frigens]|uniref:hypothetical protein n=1 Tax=Deinococcus frigens TaxID=249403 RepID=UPI0012EC551D|nr:hypothetical protein [Deinococcus frigens]